VRVFIAKVYYIGVSYFCTTPTGSDWLQMGFLDHHRSSSYALIKENYFRSARNNLELAQKYETPI